MPEKEWKPAQSLCCFVEGPVSDPISQLKRILSAGKFRQPPVDASHQIIREPLVSEILYGRWAKKRIVLLEGQAGLGKTTFAVQLSDRSACPCLWYQIGREDCDPVFLLSSLYLFFRESFPGYGIGDLEKRILAGAIAADEAPQIASRLVLAARHFYPSRYYLVFDDLHYLDSAPLSCSLLARLVATTADNVRFILISRHKVSLLFDALLQDRQTLRLTAQELALTCREVFDLSTKILAVPLPRHEVVEIHGLTEGWPMGVCLVLRSRATAPVSSGLFQGRGGTSALVDFFVRELLATFSPQTRKVLFLLAQLDEIPMALAEFLAADGVVEVREVLEEMAEKNLFVQLLPDKEEIDRAFGAFRFHQLFRETLRCIALEEMAKEEIAWFTRKAGEWFAARGKPLLALRYFLAAEEYEEAQALVRKDGIRFLSQGLHLTIYQLLGPIVPPVLEKCPWLALVYGIALMEIEPPAAYTYLASAGVLLGRREDHPGELYALAQQIIFHLAVDARYGRGSQLLPRAAELFQRLEVDLDPYACMQISFALGLGYCFFDCDLTAARRYMSRSLTLAQEYGALKYQASNRMLSGFIHLFAGYRPGCVDEIEKSLDMLTSPLVSQFFKLYLLLFQINYASLIGDFINYQGLKTFLRRFLNNRLIVQSVVGPFLLLWDIDQAVSEGHLDEARDLVAKALESEAATVSDHFLSQYLHYGAYLAARQGERDLARAWAHRSAFHRHIAGGRYYAALNEMFLGAVHSFLGEPRRAEFHFGRALAEFRSMENPWTLAAVLCHRARHRLQTNRRQEGLKDLAEALALMRRHQYRNFYGWDPQIMEALLNTAVAAGVEEEYACRLATCRLHLVVDRDTKGFPLLIVRALGPLEIRCGQGKIVGADLSQVQRRLIAIVLAAPGQQVNQEILQEQLWPECGAERGRKRFDTVLFRMRKVLDAQQGSLSLQNYIQLQSGILCLKNCRIDVVEFMEKAQEGLDHFLRGELWQACQAFSIARSLWRGSFMPGTRLEGREEAYRQELLHSYLDICCKWAEISFRGGLYFQAETLAWNALKEEPTNEPLVRVLYNCYVAQGAPVKAAQLLKSYEEALRKEEYLVEEIDEILESFWRSP